MTELIHGDCIEVLRSMPDCSVDAVVTDPPYGLSFMNKKWDYDVPSVEVWVECLRVLKPGGHLLAFAGTRTQHRMAVRIEDAGFEIRDMIAWVYGSGFPKSLDVSKAIDKAAGVEREVVGVHPCPAGNKAGGNSLNMSAVGMPATATITSPATDAAKQWQGWGTALKPALECITVARKPLIGTVAENVLQHGTGAINVDGGRVEGGRWPANLIHDGSEEVCALFPLSKSSDTLHPGSDRGSQFGQIVSSARTTGYSDYGSAARFFYCAKASKADRDAGCEGLELVTHQSGMAGAMPIDDDGNVRDRFKAQSRNHHPTVKPTDLMRYLCRLVTPPNGVVLDPFMGSGSTGKAAALEGFNFIGIEREAEYVAIAQARINHVTND